MTTPNNTSTDTRSEAEIENAIEEKIQEAIRRAAEDGIITEDSAVVVAIDPTTGEIHVSEKQNAASETPDPVEFPAAYADDHESLVDGGGMKDHFESHWGF